MTKTCSDPFDYEFLDVLVFLYDFDCLVGEAQAEHWRMACLELVKCCVRTIPYLCGIACANSFTLKHGSVSATSFVDLYFRGLVRWRALANCGGIVIQYSPLARICFTLSSTSSRRFSISAILFCNV